VCLRKHLIPIGVLRFDQNRAERKTRAGRVLPNGSYGRRSPHGSRAVGMVKRPRNRAACSGVRERREDERPAGPSCQAPFVWSKWEVATVPATPYAFGVAARTVSKLDLAASQVVCSKLVNHTGRREKISPEAQRLATTRALAWIQRKSPDAQCRPGNSLGPTELC